MSELLKLEVLTFATTPVPSPDIGKSGELRWLPLAQLLVDPSYQRAILDTGRGNIRRMVEEFSWAKFGVVVVARRGANRYAIIDGQHRATAALNHGGIVEVPCLVLDRTQAEQARDFAAINHNVTRIHALQSFRAAVAGGDADAVAIAKACAEAGVAIAPWPKTSELKPGETCALGSIRACWKKHGAEPLITALMMLRAADPAVGLSGIAVRALCETAPKHPEWNARAAQVGEYMTRGGGGLATLEHKAQERRLTRGGSLWSNFAALAEQRITAGERAGGAPLSKLMAGR